MVKFSLACSFTFFLLCSNTHVSATAYDMQINNFTYTVDPKYLKISYNFNDNRHLNVTADLFGIIDNLTVNGELFVMPSDGSSSIYHKLMAHSVDACKFLANPKSEPFINVVWQDVANNPNNKVAQKCPVQPGTYYIRDFEMDTKFIPLMMPSVLFYVKTLTKMTINNEVHKLETRTYGSLKNIMGTKMA